MMSAVSPCERASSASLQIPKVRSAVPREHLFPDQAILSTETDSERPPGFAKPSKLDKQPLQLKDLISFCAVSSARTRSRSTRRGLAVGDGPPGPPARLCGLWDTVVVLQMEMLSAGWIMWQRDGSPRSKSLPSFRKYQYCCAPGQIHLPSDNSFALSTQLLRLLQP